MPEPRSRRKAAYTPQAVSRDPIKLGSPTWLAPAMVGCFILGLLWIVVFYIAGYDLPLMSTLGPWNIVVGFAFIGVGFGLATRWK